MTVVIGMAGHIDHGKTSLLRALTGIDADRLPEERRRGMTIDVGYAHLQLHDGMDLDFVDVPGHHRLVGNMLVGAGEIDAGLLVVAVNDGVRAQTLEHLELLDALEVRCGLAVVTKIDLAADERVAEVVETVRVLLARTILRGTPVLAVSSVSGTGMDALRAALVELRDRVLAEPSHRGGGAGAGVRLAIDRSFTVKGRGVVVTGSLRGGPLTTGQTLRAEPGGASVRVRELQVHGALVTSLEGGGRVAINAAGASAEALVRGVTLTSDPDVRPTDRLLVLLRSPARLDDRVPARHWPLTAGQVYRLHLATESVDATLRRGLRQGASLPDGRELATLRLTRPIAAAIGDHLVLRVPSPAVAAAGGVVLDVAPPLGASRRRVSAAALLTLATAWDDVDATRFRVAQVDLHGIMPELPDEAVPPGLTRIDGVIVASALITRLEAEALAVVGGARAPTGAAELHRGLARSLRREATADEPTALAIARATIQELVGGGRLARSGNVLTEPGRLAATLGPEVLAAMDRLERALAVMGPPALTDAARAASCPPAGLRALETAGRIVRVDEDLAWATETYLHLEALALRLATRGPLSPATLRVAIGTSRKYVIALLEELDRRGVLRRTPAGHVPGPRRPAPPP